MGMGPNYGLLHRDSRSCCEETPLLLFRWPLEGPFLVTMHVKVDSVGGINLGVCEEKVGVNANEESVN